jgi:hypothetical protein
MREISAASFRSFAAPVVPTAVIAIYSAATFESPA